VSTIDIQSETGKTTPTEDGGVKDGAGVKRRGKELYYDAEKRQLAQLDLSGGAGQESGGEIKDDGDVEDGASNDKDVISGDLDDALHGRSPGGEKGVSESGAGSLDDKIDKLKKEVGEEGGGGAITPEAVPNVENLTQESAALSTEQVASAGISPLEIDDLDDTIKTIPKNPIFINPNSGLEFQGGVTNKIPKEMEDSFDKYVRKNNGLLTRNAQEEAVGDGGNSPAGLDEADEAPYDHVVVSDAAPIVDRVVGSGFDIDQLDVGFDDDKEEEDEEEDDRPIKLKPKSRVSDEGEVIEQVPANDAGAEVAPLEAEADQQEEAIEREEEAEALDDDLAAREKVAGERLKRVSEQVGAYLSPEHKQVLVNLRERETARDLVRQSRSFFGGLGRLTILAAVTESYLKSASTKYRDQLKARRDAKENYDFKEIAYGGLFLRREHRAIENQRKNILDDLETNASSMSQEDILEQEKALRRMLKRQRREISGVVVTLEAVRKLIDEKLRGGSVDIGDKDTDELVAMFGAIVSQKIERSLNKTEGLETSVKNLGTLFRELRSSEGILNYSSEKVNEFLIEILKSYMKKAGGSEEVKQLRKELVTEMVKDVFKTDIEF